MAERKYQVAFEDSWGRKRLSRYSTLATATKAARHATSAGRSRRAVLTGPKSKKTFTGR